MAMLKTITPRSIAGPAALRDMHGYLEGRARARKALSGVCDYLSHGAGRTRTEGSRSRAHADSPNLCVWPGTTWADAMAATKSKHRKVGGVPYYHFIVSPDPDDRVSCDECLEVAVEWVTHCHPDAEWHIDVHDDNAGRIPHAHVIVNSVIPSSGRRLHRSRGDIRAEARTLQAVCRERGLSVLPDLDEKAGWEGSVGERAERLRASTATHTVEAAMARDGRASWRASIRDAVDGCASRCTNWDDFVAGLAGRGVEVVERRRGITYRLADFRGQGPRSIKGSTLGSAYTRHGILGRLYVDWDSILGEGVDGFGRPAKGPHKAHYHPRDHRKDDAAAERRRGARVARRSYAEALAERVGRNDRWTRDRRRLEALVEAIRTVDREGVTSRTELAREVERLGTEAQSLAGRAREYAAAADRAIAIAERGRRMREDEAWLSSMRSRRLWRPAERREVRERERRLAEDRDWCGRQLATAADWAAATGHDTSDPYACGSDLAVELRATGAAIESELGALRRRHDDLARAEAAIRRLYTSEGTPAKGVPQEGRRRQARRGSGMDRRLRGMAADERTRERLDGVPTARKRAALARIGTLMQEGGSAARRGEDELRRNEAQRRARGRAFAEATLGRGPSAGAPGMQRPAGAPARQDGDGPQAGHDDGSQQQ